jgi:hypothetical protein
MVRTFRRRIGYRKTYSANRYRPVRSYGYKKRYNSGYKRRNYKRNTYKSNRFTGRQRISTILSSSISTSKDVSKILNVDINIPLTTNTPLVVYNGKHLRSVELTGMTSQIYKNLSDQLPSRLFAERYEDLTYDSSVIYPTLKLKDTKITVESNSINPVSILTFHEPLLSHFAFARDLQELFRAGGFHNMYVSSLTYVRLNTSVNDYEVTTYSQITADQKEMVKTHMNNFSHQFLEHYYTTLVGIDDKAIYKAVIIINTTELTVRHVFVDLYRVTQNIVDLRRSIVSLLYSDLLPADIDAIFVASVAKFDAHWVRAYDSTYLSPYIGIRSACVGLSRPQRLLLANWLIMIGKQASAAGLAITQALSLFCDKHKKGTLEELVLEATNALVASKMMSIRHLQADKPKMFIYLPKGVPNTFVICADIIPTPLRLRQTYKFNSYDTLRHIRIALHNNPDMLSLLSPVMKNYVDKAYPELRLYKAGQLNGSKLRRLGRQQ